MFSVVSLVLPRHSFLSFILFIYFLSFFSSWNLHWINIEPLNPSCILYLFFSAESFFFNIPPHWFVLQLCSFFNLTKLFNFLCCYFKFPSFLFIVPSPLLKKWIPHCLKKIGSSTKFSSSSANSWLLTWVLCLHGTAFLHISVHICPYLLLRITFCLPAKLDLENLFLLLWRKGSQVAAQVCGQLFVQVRRHVSLPNFISESCLGLDSGRKCQNKFHILFPLWWSRFPLGSSLLYHQPPDSIWESPKANCGLWKIVIMDISLLTVTCLAIQPFQMLLLN